MSLLGPYDLVSQIGDQVPIPSSLPFHCTLGQTVPFFCSVYQLGILVNPTAIVFTLTDPNGVVQATVTPTQDAVGTFEADVQIFANQTPGVWKAIWTTSGQAYEAAVASTAFTASTLESK